MSEEAAIYTIGHSTHSLEEFVRLLNAHSVHLIVDVRTVPRSRRVPQFNTEVLPTGLEVAGIRYLHMKDLGGWRRAGNDSPNTGWRNAGFRGYADYMQTAEFEAALSQLIELAHAERVAIMCAEAVPWRCHRSLISDALTVRGIEVRHIMSDGEARPHELTEFARVDGVRVTYPSMDRRGDQQSLDIQ